MKKQKQLSLFNDIPNALKEAASRKEHGGTLLLGKRRSRRPLSIKSPLHLVLRSDFAMGARCLLRHRPLINAIIDKAVKKFGVSIYERAIVSNHIHLLIRAKNRTQLQNFFRVVAGHIAQEILRKIPIAFGEKPSAAGGASSSQTLPPKKLREKENKFWQTRIYSRILSWGREFKTVKAYVIQNTLEALGIMTYKTRKTRQIKHLKKSQENTS